MNCFDEAQVVLGMKLPRGLVMLKINLLGYFYTEFKLFQIAESPGLKFVIANTKSRMGYHALGSLQIWDRMAHIT